MKHPLWRYLLLIAPGKSWTTHEKAVRGAVQVGDYWMEWHEETPAPTADEILEQVEELDPQIDAQIAKDERLKLFRRKWTPERQAAAQFDDTIREEMRSDWEAL